MSDHGDSSKRLKDLGNKLQKTLNERRTEQSDAVTDGAAAGLALRAILELAVGIAVTMGLGWMADRYFGTAPWIMLALLPLGLAAGVMNVMRLGQSKRANEILGGKPGAPVAPSVKDDEDD